MNLLKRWLKSFVFSGIGGGSFSTDGIWGPIWRRLPGANFDYRTEAGAFYDNGIVACAISWAERTFPEAELKCEQLNADGQWEERPHPFLDLMHNPNGDKVYGTSLLNASLITGLICDGNAYWKLDLDRLGYPNRIYAVPFDQMAPGFPNDGSQFISCYIYRPAGQGKKIVYPVEEVVQFRTGADPRCLQRGLSPLYSLCREIVLDNACSTAASAMLRNQGMPGLMYTPDQAASATDEVTIRKMRDLFRDAQTGEMAGSFLAMNLPGKVSQFGFSPKDMLFDTLRRMPEERISGAIGIPAIVLGLGAGLERSTFANFEEARRSAYETFLVPLWKGVGQQLTDQVLPLYGDDPSKVRFIYDYSHVEGLQENKDDQHERVRNDFLAGIIDRAQALTMMDMEPKPGDENVYAEPQGAATLDDEPIAKQSEELNENVKAWISKRRTN